MMTTGGPRIGGPGTLNQLFFDAVERYNKPNALQVKRNGRYEPISHSTLLERVRRVALGLQELGVRSGDRVAILSENRPEWAIADFACLSVGVTDVPIYPNLPADQAAYMLRDSGCVAIFVSDTAQAAKVASVRGGCPALRQVIVFADVATNADLTLASLETRGAAVDRDDRRPAFRDRALAVRPDDLATIIYTSGTTGEPKGVMLTHDNIFSNVQASRTAIPFSGDDVGLSFLPLSHILERMSGYYTMFATGTSIAYAESMDMVPQNLVEVRPTLAVSVPRMYEKMYARVLETAMNGGAIKKRIFVWARGVAERWADVVLAGGTPRGALALRYRIAQRLVFSKLRARTGGRLRYFVSGGAPLAADINKFFYAAGLVILEGYGLTETSPVISVNTPENFRLGTVGKPIAGVEVAIASDGEILARGPNVMKGYFNKPAATAEAIEADGWFHTGDIGEIHDGFLSITDRKKDLIVTAGGKNIAPQPIENLIKTNKYVDQVVMLGDKRRFPIALIVPDWHALGAWATEQGIPAGSHAELLATPAVREKMEAEVLGMVRNLAHFEQPKKIALLEHEFSIERGDLTPTLKVKRRVVDRTYKSLIDSLYAEPATDSRATSAGARAESAD
jgi:long-chain acyl-CoA synthetase